MTSARLDPPVPFFPAGSWSLGVFAEAPRQGKLGPGRLGCASGWPAVDGGVAWLPMAPGAFASRSSGSRAMVLLVSTFIGCASVCHSAALAHAAAPTVVDDETRSAARQLGTEGVHAYQAGDYDKASERLERAFSLLEAPSLGLWSARALEKTGRLVKAAERYLKTTRLAVEAGGDAKVQEGAKADAAKELQALEPRIPKLVIELEGASPDEVTVTVNGAAIKAGLIGTARPTDPGVVEIVARRGAEEVRQSVDLAEGQSRAVTLNLETGQALASSSPKESEAPREDAGPLGDSGTKSRWQIPVGWTTLGLGIAGLATGGVAAGMAAAEYETASAGCTNDRCPNGSEEQVAGYNTLRIVSSVGFIAGGVLTALGVTFLLTAPKRPEAAYVAPVIGLGTLGLRGRF